MRRLIKLVKEEVSAICDRDPAAQSYFEVLLCYPGLHVLLVHRLAHTLWQRRFRLIARLMSQVSRWLTGIEIHPGATIGRRVFIDHGMGVVVGETSFVGNDVTLYQGVTLGGTGKEKGKRHPTIGNNVTIGAGAKILGNITIGDNCRIGAGSVVLRDVPEHSTVVGVPGRIVHRNGERVLVNDPKEITDPVTDLVAALSSELDLLKQQVCLLVPDGAFNQGLRSQPHTDYGTRMAYRRSLGCSVISETGLMTNQGDPPWLSRIPGHRDKPYER